MRALLAPFLLNVSGFTTCGPAEYGYDIERLKALYVAANLAPIAVEGISASVRGVASRREGKVAVTFTEAAQKSGWQGTQWGQEFLDAMGDLTGGCILIGHAY